MVQVAHNNYHLVHKIATSTRQTLNIPHWQLACTIEHDKVQDRIKEIHKLTMLKQSCFWVD